MNIVQMQDSLKDLSDQQLLQTMQTDSAPHYLVLAEMQRRKKTRQETAQRQPQGTVADEIMSGIAAVPAPNMQGFSAGGIVPFQEGGLAQNAEQERVIQMLLAEAGVPDTPENRRMIVQQGMRNYFPEQYADPNRQTGLTPEELAAEPPKERRGIFGLFRSANNNQFAEGGVVPFQEGGAIGATQEAMIKQMLAEAGLPDTPANRQTVLMQFAAPAQPAEEPRIPRGLRPTKLTGTPEEERYPFLRTVAPALFGDEPQTETTMRGRGARAGDEPVMPVMPDLGIRELLSSDVPEGVRGGRRQERPTYDYLSDLGFEPASGDRRQRREAAAEEAAMQREAAPSWLEGFVPPPRTAETQLSERIGEGVGLPPMPAVAPLPTPAAPTQDEILRVGRVGTPATPAAPAQPKVGTEQLANMGDAELAQTREVAKERPDFFSPEALLALGLGMIAGGSKPGSTFGSAVGEGGLAMLQQVQSKRKAEAEREKEAMLEAGRMERTRMEQAGALERAGINADMYRDMQMGLNRAKAIEVRIADLSENRIRKVNTLTNALMEQDSSLSKKDAMARANSMIESELSQLRAQYYNLAGIQPPNSGLPYNVLTIPQP